MSQLLSDHGNVASPNEDRAPSANDNSHYCYLFPILANAESERSPDSCPTHFAHLDRLAKIIDRQISSNEDNSSLPAIYTYFGQFVNHDLSAPTATPVYSSSVSDRAAKLESTPEVVSAGPDAIALLSSERPSGPKWLVSNILNQHPKALCLYSLYGKGPIDGFEEIKELYDEATMKFRLGQTFDDPGPTHPQSELDKMLRHDLVREGNVARIADRRNDENVVIGQLHLAFMLFHNRAIDVLTPTVSEKKRLFQEARKNVTWHYQYCVMHDFLKQLVPDESAGSDLRLQHPGAVPFEFTTAAFRFGHSMISQKYNYNRFFNADRSEDKRASLSDLFRFTSRRKMGHSDDMGADIPGNGRLPTHWVIDWQRFLQVAPQKGSAADLIDTNFASTLITLGDLTGEPKMHAGLSSIINRNIKRGYHRFMPCGQDIAEKLGITPLTSDQIRGAFTDVDAPAMFTATSFDIRTPLWVYFLCEAKVLGVGGKTLGPVAGSIVRGTIQALLRNNPDSVVNCDNGNWTPERSPLKLPDGGAIKDIKTFLQFAGVLESTPV